MQSEIENPKSKILVTGGCGYIGSHTVCDLLSNGFEVVSVDSHIRSRAHVPELIEQITGKHLKNYALDLCDKAALRQVFQQEENISGIIHFAALKSVPESVAHPLRYFQNNMGSLLNTLELAEEFGVKQFVFSSSCTVYGRAQTVQVTEETPMGEAESPYGRTKQMGEHIISDLARTSNMHFVLLRYFNPVGAHESGLLGEDSPDVVTALVPRITGTAIGKFPQLQVFGNDYDTLDGSCIRDYVHVMDIAHAHTLALLFLNDASTPLSMTAATAARAVTLSLSKGEGNPHIFNLGTGKGVTVLEAIESFERVSGQKLNYKIVARREGDIAAIYANNSKAVSQLGWKAERDLDAMMRTAWSWEQYLAQRH